jgi:quercetin dioxygenase-like cupin family protein
MLIDWNRFPETGAKRAGSVRKSVSGEGLSAMLVEANGGAVFDGKLHHHIHEQMVIVVSGDVVVKLEEENIAATAGDLVYIPSGKRHAVVSVGLNGARFFELSAPARIDQLAGWLGPSALNY